MGAASGATLGLAAASLAIPGIGPVIAFGMVGAALLGVVGAAAGSAVGDTVEDELGEGVPHEDIILNMHAALAVDRIARDEKTLRSITRLLVMRGRKIRPLRKTGES